VKRSIRWVLPAIVMLIAGIVVWHYVPIGELLQTGRQFVQAQGARGVLIFVLGYAVAVALFAPAAPLTIAAGALWGGWGAPVALVGALSAAMISFGLSRYVLRRHCAELCAQHPITLQLDDVVARLGWKAVLLVRLSPVIPFAAQNYAFGMTGVRARDFALASVPGILPATIVETWIGMAGTVAEWNLPTIALAVIGTLATIGFAVLLVRQMRRGLRDPLVRSTPRHEGGVRDDD
jgi:uncharacterized membrane protein YdjX (TVP38/TMEM64 family)